METKKFDSFQKSLKLNLTCILTCAEELKSFKWVSTCTYMSTLGMHRRPFEGRHLVQYSLLCIHYWISYSLFIIVYSLLDYSFIIHYCVFIIGLFIHYSLAIVYSLLDYSLFIIVYSLLVYSLFIHYSLLDFFLLGAKLLATLIKIGPNV